MVYKKHKETHALLFVYFGIYCFILTYCLIVKKRGLPFNSDKYQYFQYTN